MVTYILVGLICLIVGWLAGWLIAHKTVAVECERLGGFYYNEKTFKCVEINERRKS